MLILKESQNAYQHWWSQYKIYEKFKLYLFLGFAILYEECGYEPLRTGAGGHDQWGDEGGLKDKIIVLLQVEKKGVIYFDDVCKLILRKFREDDEEEFIKIMFKVNCSS